MGKHYVIAVAAPIGGGKTSLAKAIAARLGDAVTIHFDRYETVTRRPIEDVIRWVEAGGDFNELSVPHLAEDLGRLKRGEPVFDPASCRETPSGKYVLFEMPLGRKYQETAELIDFLIWVEVPFDVALARKIKEFAGEFMAHERPEELGNFAAWLNGYLDNYLKVVRRVLQIQRDRVCPDADMVLDGRAEFDTMITHATREILHRFPSK